MGSQLYKVDNDKFVKEEAQMGSQLYKVDNDKFVKVDTSPWVWQWHLLPVSSLGHRQSELLLRTRIYRFIIYIGHIMINILHFCAFKNKREFGISAQMPDLVILKITKVSQVL